MEQCVSEEIVREYLDDRLSEADFPAVKNHLATCRRCKSLVETVLNEPPKHQRDVFPRPERYEILAVAGRGGMGTVYRARDRELNRTVAVKVLHARFVGDDGTAAETPDLRKRFTAEARTLAALEANPGIIPVSDVGVFPPPDGRTYFVMKFVEGHTWADRLNARKHPHENLDADLRIVQQVAEIV